MRRGQSAAEGRRRATHGTASDVHFDAHVARRRTTASAVACPGKPTRVSCDSRRWQGVEAAEAQQREIKVDRRSSPNGRSSSDETVTLVEFSSAKRRGGWAALPERSAATATATSHEAVGTRWRRRASSPAPNGGAGGPRFRQEARLQHQPHRTRQLGRGGGEDRVLLRQSARRVGREESSACAEQA